MRANITLILLIFLLLASTASCIYFYREMREYKELATHYRNELKDLEREWADRLWQAIISNLGSADNELSGWRYGEVNQAMREIHIHQAKYYLDMLYGIYLGMRDPPFSDERFDNAGKPIGAIINIMNMLADREPSAGHKKGYGIYMPDEDLQVIANFIHDMYHHLNSQNWAMANQLADSINRWCAQYRTENP